VAHTGINECRIDYCNERKKEWFGWQTRQSIGKKEDKKIQSEKDEQTEGTKTEEMPHTWPGARAG
jgi:hypothetical protein